ncbi:hypothetical protein ACRRTK_001905 [Alexandromys fortis]
MLEREKGEGNEKEDEEEQEEKEEPGKEGDCFLTVKGRAGLRKEEPNTGNINSLRFSSVHLLMARTPGSKTFVGVLKHHPVHAPDEDRIFWCH